MKLFTRGLLLIAVPSVFEVVCLGLLLRGQQATNEATVWALHSKDVIEQSSVVDRAVLNEAVRFRGAILGGTPSEAEPTFWDQLDASLVTLATLVGDNPLQQERVTHLRELAKAYRLSLQQTERIALQGHPGELAARYQTLPNKGVLVQFEDLLDDFKSEERRLDTVREQVAVEARQRQRGLLLLIILGSIVLAIAVTRVFSRSVGARLSKLVVNAQRLAQQEPLLPVIRGNDEIAELDHVLHKSSAELQLERERAIDAQREVEARALELAGVNKALRQQTTENEMFVYSVSHDLRSPLVNLQGFGKELRLGCDDLRKIVGDSALDDQTRQRMLAIIDQDIFSSLKYLDSAVLRSAGIIDAMLRLSRAGRVEYHPRENNVKEVVQRIAESIHGALKERNVTIEIEELPAAFIDPSVLEQVFANLMNNAVNYRDPKRPGVIHVGAVADAGGPEGFNTYFVRDNGLGIPEHLQSKLFVAFQRLHGNVAPGEGIGLALIHRAIERNGGRVWVESAEGVGSTFFVSLPQSRAAYEVSTTTGP